MKNLFISLLINVLFFNNVNATDQQPDTIFYANEKLTLDIGWGHPSPLETYFRQNNLKYPFTMLHTANYRGHIATWKIVDNKLYITEVAIRDKKFKPNKFNIKSQNNVFSNEEQVFADWFSGVLVCQKRVKKKYWETEYSIYIYVRNGEVLTSEKITKKDFKRIENLSSKDTSDTSLMSKYSLLYMNQSYISYYFRLTDKETITIDNKIGYIKGKNGNSIILEFYDNNHLNWPYNWENIERNGAPNGVWKIADNKLLITSINLNTGLNFDGPEKIDIELSSIFRDKLENNNVFADWTNGIYLITHGEEEVADKLMPDFKIFKEKEYTLIRVKEGIVQEKYTISSEFDLDNIPDTTNEGLKNIIIDYKKQRK